MWKRSLTVAALMLAVFPLLLSTEAPAPAVAEDDWWLDDYATALALAKRANKPILVEFR